MKNFTEIKEILETMKPVLEQQYKVKEIGIFGSYAKYKQQETSDLDILVEFKETPTLLQFINLKNYLSDILEVKVDLVMKTALKPHLGKSILKEVIFI
jgi:predicted nucleotidyltransferase